MIKPLRLLLGLSCCTLLLVWWSKRPRPIAPPPPRVFPAYRPDPGPVPRFVTYHLAQYHLTDDSKWRGPDQYQGVIDFESNYCVQSSNGPDGCEYILELGPASTWRWGGGLEENRQELAQIFRGARLNLVTGRGVSIGDTPQQVQRKIGPPTAQAKRSDLDPDEHKTHQTLVYGYVYTGKRLYQARYTFQEGRLNHIWFRQANPPSQYTGPNGGCP